MSQASQSRSTCHNSRPNVLPLRPGWEWMTASHSSHSTGLTPPSPSLTKPNPMYSVTVHLPIPRSQEQRPMSHDALWKLNVYQRLRKHRWRAGELNDTRWIQYAFHLNINWCLYWSPHDRVSVRRGRVIVRGTFILYWHVNKRQCERGDRRRSWMEGWHSGSPRGVREEPGNNVIKTKRDRCRIATGILKPPEWKYVKEITTR